MRVSKHRIMETSSLKVLAILELEHDRKLQIEKLLSILFSEFAKKAIFEFWSFKNAQQLIWLEIARKVLISEESRVYRSVFRKIVLWRRLH